MKAMRLLLPLAVETFMACLVVFAPDACVARVAQAATITVNSLANTQVQDDDRTLREAIVDANRDDQSGSVDCAPATGTDSINFSVGGALVHKWQSGHLDGPKEPSGSRSGLQNTRKRSETPTQGPEKRGGLESCTKARQRVHFTAAWAEGRAMTVERAVACALEPFQ